jgi:AmmeMemoRadiSam system protein B
MRVTFIYSGRVAALAFATLFDSAPTLGRIVLIGPAHYVASAALRAPLLTLSKPHFVTSQSTTMA